MDRWKHSRRTPPNAVPQLQHPRRPQSPGKRGASRQIHQTISNGVNDELGGLVNAKAVHNVGAMDRDRVDAEIELGGDLLVRFAGDDVLQNLEFTRCECRYALAFEGFGALELRIENRLSGCDALDSFCEI